MKVFISILFSLFYLTSTSGITLSAHYCGGKMKHISLFKKSEKNCCGKKKMSKNCCKDKVTHFKVKDNHQSSDLVKSPTPTSKLSVFVLPVLEYHLTIDDQVHSILNYHAPPVLYDNPLYLKYKVLLI